MTQKRRKTVRRTQVDVLYLWVRALRSGKYKQARGQLRRRCGANQYAFCCLGVLCDLARKDGGPDWDPDWGGQFYMSIGGVLPKVFMDWLGMEDHHQRKLMSMNDNGFNFIAIARYIEHHIIPEIERKAR